MAIIVALGSPIRADASVGTANTINIVAGAGVLYELVRYFVDQHKTNGSRNQANETFANVTFPDPHLSTNASPVTSMSLQQARALVIAAMVELDYEPSPIPAPSASSAASTTQPDSQPFLSPTPSPRNETVRTRLRAFFEDYRVCWNATIADPAPSSSPSPSPSASTSPPAKKPATTKQLRDLDASLTPKPSPSPTKIPGCRALIEDDLPKDFSTDVDLIDLRNALKSPSLFQQAINQNVGSYDGDNYVRSQLLVEVANELVKELASPSVDRHEYVDNVDNKDIAGLGDVLAKCHSSPDPAGCVNALDSVEQTIAKERNQAVICNWARYAWMPTFTQIRRKTVFEYKKLTSTVFEHRNFVTDEPGVEQIDYGAAPGC